MKRWKIILPTLLATTGGLPLVSLVSCGEPAEPPVFSQEGIGFMIDSKTAFFNITWTPPEDYIVFSRLVLITTKGGRNEVTCVSKEGSSPCRLEVVFNNDVTQNIDDGILNIYYEDKTAKISDVALCFTIHINKYNPVIIKK